MLIKAKKTIAGPLGIICAGKVGELPEKLAVSLVSKGCAEYIDAPPDGVDTGPRIEDLLKRELIDLCKAKGIQATGNRDTLIKRLLEAEESGDEAESEDETATTDTLETTAIR